MHTHIGLVAAMPEETGPLLKKVADVTREQAGEFTFYRFSLSGKRFCIVESGMGPRRAAAATTALIAVAAPELIINFGLAGGVTNDLRAGDIAIAMGAADYTNCMLSVQLGISDYHAQLALALLKEKSAQAGYQIHPATFITSGQILNKRELAVHLPVKNGAYLLDMETTAIAMSSESAGIPLLAVRAVSDGADEELEFTIDEFTDESMTIRPWRVLKTVARKPRIIPQLIRLAKNAKIAGANLAEAMMTLLESELK